jgi:D-alanine--poly(phosphoribitol) ligase subunit 2
MERIYRIKTVQTKNCKKKEIKKMEELLEILEDIGPDADYKECTTLIDDGILDSFAILSIISELEDTFDVKVTPAEIIPENFNSAKALWEMVQRLQAE